MKRILIAILLLVAIAALGGHYYYERQVEQRVDSAARMLGQMGGNLDYREVVIGLSGDIRVEDILLRVPGMPSAVSIDWASLHTGGLMGVHRLAMDAREQLLPTRLGVSFDGIRIPLSSVTQSGNLGVTDAFAAAGCGDRTAFSALDIVKMGYSEFVMDTRVDYRLVGDGELLNLTVDTLMREMNNTRVEMDFSLGAPSRHAPAVAMAMANAQLLSVVIDYQDKGYAQRVSAFCTEQTGLDREAFLAQHLSAWQDVWHQFGLTAGPTLVDGYREFLSNPDQFRVQIKPSGSLHADDFSGMSTELMLYYLPMQLSVNQGPMKRLDLSAMDEAEAQAWREARRERTVDSDSEAEQSGDTGQAQDDEGRITMEALRNAKDATVELRLANGRSLEGVVHSIGEDRLQLQRFQNGGYVIQPVDYVDIEEAYLRKK